MPHLRALKVILLSIIPIGIANVALAGGGSCPTAYDTASCQNFCFRDPANGMMVCDISAEPGDNDVVVVKNYPVFIIVGTESYSAWGTANGVDFCCRLNSSAASPINSVAVYTGAGSDEVWFTAFDVNGNQRSLSSNQFQTAAPWFVGYVYPGGGNDIVYGSNSLADNYMDHLTGEDGGDTIHGNKGADFISVAETRTGARSTGNFNESVYGDNGRDEIVGATNDPNATDTIFVSGGDQNDLLCTGSTGQLTGQKVFFFGGNGDDEIYSHSSNVAGFDGAINGDSGSNGCSNPGGSGESNCQRAFTPANFGPWAPMVCF